MLLKSHHTERQKKREGQTERYKLLHEFPRALVKIRHEVIKKNKEKKALRIEGRDLRFSECDII